MHALRLRRHLVALPIGSIGLLVLALVHATFGSTAAALTTGDGMESVMPVSERMDLRVPSGARATLEPGSRFRIDPDGATSLFSGTATIDAPGIALIRHGCSSTTVIGGAATLIVSAQRISVVPLSAPVLVTDCAGDRAFIVPSMQGSLSADGSVAQSVVPAAWLQPRLIDHPVLAPRVVLDALEQSRDLRAVSSEVTHLLESLQRDVSSLDALGAGDIGTLFSLRFLGIWRPLESALQESMAASLMQHGVLDESMVPIVPLLVLATPRSLPPMLLTAWGDAVVRLAARDPSSVRAVLDRASVVPSILGTAGFPQQSSAWQQMLARTERTVAPVLPVTPPASSLASSSSASMISSASTLAPDELLAAARQSLHAMGALSTVRTSLTLSPQQGFVDVRGIVLSERDGDHAYDLTLDPIRGLAISILRDGIPAPNALTVEQLASLGTKEGSVAGAP